MSETRRFNDQENRLRRLDMVLAKPLPHSVNKPPAAKAVSRFRRVPLGSKNSNNARPGLDKAVTSLDPSSARMNPLVARPPPLAKSQSLLGIAASASVAPTEIQKPAFTPLNILKHSPLTDLGPENALRDSQLVERHLVTDNLCKPDVPERIDQVPTLRSTFSANTAALSALNIPQENSIMNEPTKRSLVIPPRAVLQLEASDYALDLASGTLAKPSYRPHDVDELSERDMQIFSSRLMHVPDVNPVSKSSLSPGYFPLDQDLPMTDSERVIPDSIDNLGLTEEEMLDLLD